MNKINMTGWVMKEHGVPDSRFTVLYELPERKNKQIIWHCKCECGNECNITGIDLRRGHSKSCGCLQKERTSESNTINLLGQKFGKLTVIEKIGIDQNSGHIRWKCKCDCGNEIITKSSYLIDGSTKSCGCIKSKGEEKISQILFKNHILFKREKKFDDCRFKDTNVLARFDFYINNQYIIEYDGKQHFEARGHGWNTEENLIKTQERDKFKNQYCFEHNIPIIRIPYTHLNQICLEDLIPETSQFLLKQEE